LLDAALFLIFAVVIPLLFIITEVKHGVLRKGSTWQGFSILPFLILLFIPTYIILLVLNTTLLDASTSLTATHRYLLPVFALMVIMLTCMVFRLVENKSRGIKIATLVIAVIFFGFFLSESISFLRSPVKDMGYTDIKRSWTNVVGALNQIDSSHLFISDNVELFYFLAGRPAYAFPISYDNYTQQERQDYNDQITKARKRLEQGAIIVLFYPEEGQIKALEQLGVDVLYEFPQAIFYHLPGK
jgi:hypothetical protein